MASVNKIGVLGVFCVFGFRGAPFMVWYAAGYRGNVDPESKGMDD